MWLPFVALLLREMATKATTISDILLQTVSPKETKKRGKNRHTQPTYIKDYERVFFRPIKGIGKHHVRASTLH